MNSLLLLIGGVLISIINYHSHAARSRNRTCDLSACILQLGSTVFSFNQIHSLSFLSLKNKAFQFRFADALPAELFGHSIIPDNTLGIYEFLGSYM